MNKSRRLSYVLKCVVVALVLLICFLVYFIATNQKSRIEFNNKTSSQISIRSVSLGYLFGSGVLGNHKYELIKINLYEEPLTGCVLMKNAKGEIVYGYKSEAKNDETLIVDIFFNKNVFDLSSKLKEKNVFGLITRAVVLINSKILTADMIRKYDDIMRSYYKFAFLFVKVK